VGVSAAVRVAVSAEEIREGLKELGYSRPGVSTARSVVSVVSAMSRVVTATTGATSAVFEARTEGTAVVVPVVVMVVLMVPEARFSED